MKKANAYLITYDIACRKRWLRVYKKLKRIGERQQLSVFSVVATPSRAKRLEQDLNDLIDQKEDRLMIVNLGASSQAENRIVGNATPDFTPKPIII